MPSKVKSNSLIPHKGGLFLTVRDADFDPQLMSLFTSSNPQPVTSNTGVQKTLSNDLHVICRDELSSEDGGEGSELSDLPLPDTSYNGFQVPQFSTVSELSGNGDAPLQRKRKRKNQGDDIEEFYLQRLAKEEEREYLNRQNESFGKRVRLQEPGSQPKDMDGDNFEQSEGTTDVESDEYDDMNLEIPQHETLTNPNNNSELEKAERTVFLANVSTSAITSKVDKKTLLKHLASFTSALPVHHPSHSIESIRFRSTAFSNTVPKKAAFAKKELMDATTKSTNAYVVYSTSLAAQEAAKRLNGTIILGRHLRVDTVTSPAKIDNRRCVFVGNLGYVDDESQVIAAKELGEKKKSKPKPPSDIEEGLWQQFGHAGIVESVRVVRDPKTRVGKGFAYVQFANENAVEAALLYNDKKFPPLLPRKLRVVRAKKVMQKNRGNGRISAFSGNSYSKSSRRASDRNVKLLGRAGAAKMKVFDDGKFATAPDGGNTKSPEHSVFEGHRASSKQGNRGLKLGGSGRKKGKPRTRSAKRGTAWKLKGYEKGTR